MQGEGPNGKVFLAFELDFGQTICVKRIETPGLDEKALRKEFEKIKQELSYCVKMDHPNITAYIGVNTSESGFDLLMEMVPGGSIRDLLSKFGGFNEKLCKIYVRQILEGLK